MLLRASSLSRQLGKDLEAEYLKQPTCYVAQHGLCCRLEPAISANIVIAVQAKFDGQCAKCDNKVQLGVHDIARYETQSPIKRAVNSTRKHRNSAGMDMAEGYRWAHVTCLHGARYWRRKYGKNDEAVPRELERLLDTDDSEASGDVAQLDDGSDFESIELGAGGTAAAEAEDEGASRTNADAAAGPARGGKRLMRLRQHCGGSAEQQERELPGADGLDALEDDVSDGDDGGQGTCAKPRAHKRRVLESDRGAAPADACAADDAMAIDGDTEAELEVESDSGTEAAESPRAARKRNKAVEAAAAPHPLRDKVIGRAFAPLDTHARQELLEALGMSVQEAFEAEGKYIKLKDSEQFRAAFTVFCYFAADFCRPGNEGVVDGLQVDTVAQCEARVRDAGGSRAERKEAAATCCEEITQVLSQDLAMGAVLAQVETVRKSVVTATFQSLHRCASSVATDSFLRWRPAVVPTCQTRMSLQVHADHTEHTRRLRFAEASVTTRSRGLFAKSKRSRVTKCTPKRTTSLTATASRTAHSSASLPASTASRCQTTARLTATTARAAGNGAGAAGGAGHAQLATGRGCTTARCGARCATSRSGRRRATRRGGSRGRAFTCAWMGSGRRCSQVRNESRCRDCALCSRARSRCPLRVSLGLVETH